MAHRSVQSEVYALTDPVQRERRGNLGYPFIIVRTRKCDLKSLQLPDRNPTGETRHVRGIHVHHVCTSKCATGVDTTHQINSNKRRGTSVEIHDITCAHPPVRSEAYTLNESRKQDCRGTSVGVHFHSCVPLTTDGVVLGAIFKWRRLQA